MHSLVLELSTARGSLALFRDRRCIQERHWDQSAMPTTYMYTAWSDLLRPDGLELRDVDRWICGRGPGRFSSLRIAITAARAAAVATGAEVFCISSAEGLAYDVARGEDADSVIVLGDARRESVWLARFVRDGDSVRLDDRGWLLIPRDETMDHIPIGSIAVSPDADRLRQQLPESAFDGGTRSVEARFPEARSVGLAAFHRIAAGDHGEDLTPLYLHPPVSGTAISNGQA